MHAPPRSRAALSAGIGSTGVCPPSPTREVPRPAVLFWTLKPQSLMDSTFAPLLTGLIPPQFDCAISGAAASPMLPVLRATIDALTWTVSGAVDDVDAAAGVELEALSPP